MSAATEWARVLRGDVDQDEQPWKAPRESMGPDPLFGTRREWMGYSFEPTGFGSIELRGALAHRVSIVHPADDAALRLHHRLVRSGRQRPPWYRYRQRLDTSRIHVIDREGLVRTRSDLSGSWLSEARAVARSCGEDHEVARMAGPVLRQLLWSGRTRLDSVQVTAALSELLRATEALAAERGRYRAAVDRWVGADRTDPPLPSVSDLVQRDVESIRLEAQVLAEVRREWDDASTIGPWRPAGP